MVDKVILPVVVVLIFLIFLLAAAAMCLEDTETFQAIDERIARLVRGEEEDE